ncbi:hypothetical protein SLA2020_389180 [Shorea laevis]
MSNITGDEGSFSSGNTGEEVHQESSNKYITTSMAQPQQLPQPLKKKRNLPGTPDPKAEVIALSPTTLMATNRFVCEICNKGFQRDQNLQLHRRGHNLPWKLKQRSSTECNPIGRLIKRAAVLENTNVIVEPSFPGEIALSPTGLL